MEGSALKRDGSAGPDASTEPPLALDSEIHEAPSNGRCEDVFKMTPEELAFMRSLGWEENGDDAGGMSLTESCYYQKFVDCPLHTACCLYMQSKEQSSALAA